MRFLFLMLLATPFFVSCDRKEPDASTDSLKEYFKHLDTGVQTGGVKMIPVRTASGEFKVWTKRFGNNPKTKILLLHGGPAAGHEYMECFESFFPPEGIEFY